MQELILCYWPLNLPYISFQTLGWDKQAGIPVPYLPRGLDLLLLCPGKGEFIPFSLSSAQQLDGATCSYNTKIGSTTSRDRIGAAQDRGRILSPPPYQTVLRLAHSPPPPLHYTHFPALSHLLPLFLNPCVILARPALPLGFCAWELVLEACSHLCTGQSLLKMA